MSARRLVVVAGLGFGDCGKGLVTDHAVRRHGAHTVLRFNGGAQAGHNVVLPDGRHHTFSQLGAGSFSAGVFTVLGWPVVAHPTALLAEAEALARSGVADALERLLVDPRCRVTTPFHQAAGRLREWLRGAAAHGSCGAGFGETVGHTLAHADEAVHWADLVAEGPRPGDGVLDRLEAIRTRLRADLLLHAHGERSEAALRAHAEWRVLDDGTLAARWLALARGVARRTAPGGRDAVLARLGSPGTVVAEGAQGLLLDERFGFHPHTTWSSAGPAAAEAVVGEAGRPAETVRLGVVRSYLTRHGAGPFPTEDAALDAALPEPHNAGGGWQGRFRRGQPDAVLLRHAVAAAGGLDGIVVTHLDALERIAGGLRWCEAYRVPASTPPIEAALCVVDPAEPSRVKALGTAAAAAGLDASRRLGVLLAGVQPVYAAAPIGAAAELVERIAAAAGVPVCATAAGPTHAHVTVSGRPPRGRRRRRSGASSRGSRGRSAGAG